MRRFLSKTILSIIFVLETFVILFPLFSCGSVDKIAIKGMDFINDNLYTLTVPADENKFLISNYLEVPNNTEYIIASDREGKNVLMNITLEYGENRFYIIDITNNFNCIELVITRSATTYTATFRNEDGSVFYRTEVKHNEFLTAPTDIPTKLESEFVKWNFDFTQPITSTVEIFPIFNAIKYTISYNLNGGSFASEQPTEYTYYSEDIYIANPTKDGYDFAGWNTGLVKDYVILKNSHNAVQLVANWTAKTFNATFSVKGDTSVFETTTFTYNESIGVLPIPSENEHEFFTGWSYTDGTGEHEISDNQVWTYLSEDVTLVAKYVEAVQVTFNNADGSTFKAEKILKGTKVTAPATNPEKEYSVFSGWNFDFNTEIAEDAVITPIFNDTVFGISYNLNGGSFASEQPTEYTYYSEDIHIANPTKDGYDFAGWNTGLVKDYVILKNSHNAVQLVANWTAKTFNATFSVKGDTSVFEATMFTYNESIGVLPIPSENEHEFFTGWSYTDGTGEHEISDNQVWTYLSEDVTLVAKYVEAVQVTFNNADGSTFKAEKILKGAKVTVPATNPEKEYSVFSGWNFDFNTEITEDAVITPIFNDTVFGITYNLNGGSFASEQPTEYTYYSEDIHIANPTKDGYDFAGWNTGLVKDYVILKNSHNAVQLVANWTAKTCTVIYNVLGNTSVIPSGTFTYKESVGTLPVPELDETKLFVSWIYNDGEEHVIENDSVWTYALSCEITLTAKYEDCATVTFTNGAGGVFCTEKVIIGELISIPETSPERAHASFSGWNYDFTVSVTAGNKTIDPIFTLTEYEIKYLLDGGEYKLGSQGKVSYTYYDADYKLPDPIKAGYIFSCWKDSENNTVTTLPAQSFGTKTFTAIWIAKVFNVSYVANEVEVATGSVTFGEEITSLPSFTPNGTDVYGSWCYENESGIYSVIVGNNWLFDSDSSDIVVTATYKTKVVFKLNGGNIDGYYNDVTETLVTDTHISISDPIFNDKEFLGWFIQYNGKNIYYNSTFKFNGTSLYSDGITVDGNGDVIIVNAVYGDTDVLEINYSVRYGDETLSYSYVRVPTGYIFELAKTKRVNTDVVFLGYRVVDGDQSVTIHTAEDLWNYINSQSSPITSIELEGKWHSGYTE